ncbi:MAG: hypothetical protein EA370_10985 [Wenzhouxiangella sp.]|nr:MAG: hypothetical protein EA370_10985 [Wenzhouxiangella sp.]
MAGQDSRKIAKAQDYPENKANNHSAGRFSSFSVLFLEVMLVAAVFSRVGTHIEHESGMDTA